MYRRREAGLATVRVHACRRQRQTGRRTAETPDRPAHCRMPPQRSERGGWKELIWWRGQLMELLARIMSEALAEELAVGLAGVLFCWGA